jgi:hypothetical protein
MAFKSTDSRIGAQALDDTRTVQEHPLLTRTKGNDPALGEGEFIYLKGVGSTVAGNAVVYDEAGATTRTVAASRGPVAIAMSANVANQYGWYQIRGIATVSALTVVADAPVSLSATDGSLDDLTTAQYAVENARWMSATDTPSTGKAYAVIDGPFASGGTLIS